MVPFRLQAHNEQRHHIAPAFHHASLTNLCAVFSVYAAQLGELWFHKAKDLEVEVNCNRDMSALTLDIIGLAGLGTYLSALSDEPSTDLLRAAHSKSVVMLLPMTIDCALHFPDFLLGPESGSLQRVLWEVLPLIRHLPCPLRYKVRVTTDSTRFFPLKLSIHPSSSVQPPQLKEARRVLFTQVEGIVSDKITALQGSPNSADNTPPSNILTHLAHQHLEVRPLNNPCCCRLSKR